MWKARLKSEYLYFLLKGTNFDLREWKTTEDFGSKEVTISDLHLFEKLPSSDHSPRLKKEDRKTASKICIG